MKCYRGTDGDLCPVEMECEKFGYPYHTNIGELMYLNTHFLTEEEAWASIMKSVEAGIRLAGSDVITAEKVFEKAKDKAVKAITDYVIVNRYFHKWEDEKHSENDK